MAHNQWQQEIIRLKSVISDLKKNKKTEARLTQSEKYLAALNQSKDVLLTSGEEDAFQQYVDILGPTSNASRTYIFINHTNAKGENLMSQKAEYSARGIKPEIDNPDLQDLRYDDFFRRWKNTLSKGGKIYGKIQDFPADEKDFLEIQDIQAILVVPIRTNKEFLGFIGFDNCVSDREWNTAEQNFLQAAANDLAQYIERNIIQEQLKAENLRFQATMNALDSVVYVSDMQTYELLYMNDYAKKIGNANIGGKCYSTLQKGQTEPCSFCTNHLLIDKNGNPRKTYVWEIQNTIDKRWYNLRDKAIQWPDGRLVRLEIATDITEHKKAEEEIKKLSAAVEQSSNAIVITDVNANIEYINPKFTNITGYTAKEVLGENLQILNAGPTSKEYFNEMWKTIALGNTWSGEFQNKRKDGKLFWVNVTISPIKNKNGKIINYLVEEEDITALKENEKLLTSLINASPNAIFFKDNAGRWLKANKAGLELFGLNNINYKGKTDSELANSAKFYKDALLSSAEFDEVSWQKKTMSNKEQIIQMRDGSQKIYNIIRVPLFNEDNSKQNLLVIGINISESKKKENDLREALAKAKESDRLKAAFLQNISHEIRTPMNGILGFSNLLRDPLLSGDEQQSYVDIILGAGNRMLKTLDDLMNISMLETDHVKPVISSANINNKLKSLFDFFLPETQNKGIQLLYNTSLPSNEVNIKTDVQKLYDILSNLLKNAIRYTHRGNIEFGYIKKEGFLEFYVKDTGIGVPKNKREAIFERFVQADMSDNKVYKGFGLGLSITKAYVEMLGGQIWLESEEKQGSQFYFTIPYNYDTIGGSLNKEDSPQSILGSQTKKINILIVEDEDITDEYLSIILEDISSTILHAKTGKEAIEAYRQNPNIDLILMDIKMPIMDGYEASRKIRELNKDVIIIAQTAYALEGDREKTINAGCNDYIKKPVDKDKLIKMILKHINKDNTY